MCTSRGEFKGSSGVALVAELHKADLVAVLFEDWSSIPMVVAEKTVDGMIGFLSVK